MANIKKELNDIKNAVYGKEVRGSIHDGIKKINDEVENATDLSESAKHQVENIQQQVNQLVVEGDSSVEAAQARVDAEGKSYPTLKARLDAKETEFRSQLAQKAQFDDVNQIHYPITKTKPFITFIDDDGRKEVITKLKPIFESRGVPAVVAAISDRIGEEPFATREELLELQNIGWEIASHARTNIDLTTLNREELEEELSESLKKLRGMGFNVSHMVYPQGKHNELVREVTAKYYKTGIRTLGFGKNSPPITQYMLNRQAVGSYTSPEVNRDYLKNLIDECKAKNLWLIFMTHIAVTDEEGLSDIEYCLDYAISQGIEIGTVEEGFEIFGNRLFFGDYTGEQLEDEYIIYTNTGNRYENRKSKSQVTVNTPLQNFKTGTTINYFLNTDTDADFPGVSGTLITHRPYTDYWGLPFGYQLFLPYQAVNVNKIYYRRAREDGTWRSWETIITESALDEKIDNELHVTRNKYDANTPASAFPPGRVTTFYVTTSNSAGFPVNVAGIVTTYTADPHQAGYARQEYRRFNSWEMYVRYEKTDGTWSNWKLAYLPNP